MTGQLPLLLQAIIDRPDLALAFERGPKGLRCRAGGMLVVPARHEQILPLVPYRPSGFRNIAKGVWVAFGLHPDTREYLAVVDGTTAEIGVKPTISGSDRVTIRLPLVTTVPVGTTVWVRVMLEPYPHLVAVECEVCGKRGGEHMTATGYRCSVCPPQYQPAPNGPNPFGEDVAFSHSFEEEW